MAVLQATGVVVGKFWDKREYMSQDGRTETMDLIRINVADQNGASAPVELQLTKEQYAAVVMWKTYSLPVEARAYTTRAGAVNLAYQVQREFDITKGVLVNAPPPPINK